MKITFKLSNYVFCRWNDIKLRKALVEVCGKAFQKNSFNSDS